MIQIQVADINFFTILSMKKFLDDYCMHIVYMLSKNNITLIILKKKNNEEEITFGITWGG